MGATAGSPASGSSGQEGSWSASTMGSSKNGRGSHRRAVRDLRRHQDEGAAATRRLDGEAPGAEPHIRGGPRLPRQRAARGRDRRALLRQEPSFPRPTSPKGGANCSTMSSVPLHWCCRRHGLHCGDRGFADRTVRAAAAGPAGRYLALARRARPGADAWPDLRLVAGSNVYDALTETEPSATYDLGQVIAVSVLAYLLAEMFMGRGKSSTSSR